MATQPQDTLNNQKGEFEMKEFEYVEPQMEVTLFENNDVITTSGGIELPDDDWGVEGFDF